MRHYEDYLIIGSLLVILLLIIRCLKRRHARLADLVRVYQQDNGRGNQIAAGTELFNGYQVLREMDGQLVMQYTDPSSGKITVLIRCYQLWQLTSGRNEILVVGYDLEGCIVDVLQVQAREDDFGEIALVSIDFSTKEPIDYIYILDGGGLCVCEKGSEEQVLWPEGRIQDAFGEHQLRMSEG